MSSIQKASPLLSLARGFELETSNMEVPSPNHRATRRELLFQKECLENSLIPTFHVPIGSTRELSHSETESDENKDATMDIFAYHIRHSNTPLCGTILDMLLFSIGL
ncbi:hypothetical protein H5410_053150 [Solanum commersonii]|uniref:Uncharacterized protein n=1 Tax=Solanum commersonii TaxID=4109 RepID=A0A9J5X320_SOLCO|nr:hypothetical protein H5410_053150 [Solanum commersonii]